MAVTLNGADVFWLAAYVLKDLGQDLDEKQNILRVASKGHGLRMFVNLSSLHLEGASLQGAHLEGAILSGAHLEGSLLDYACLKNALLDRAHPEHAGLVRAHLEDSGGRFLIRGATPEDPPAVCRVHTPGTASNMSRGVAFW